MPDNEHPPVLTCPFCGRADEAASMLEVLVEHRNPAWPVSQMLCSQCAAAVGQAIHRELTNYNGEESSDGLFHFGLAGTGSSDTASGDGADGVLPDTQAHPDEPGIHERQSGADRDGDVAS